MRIDLVEGETSRTTAGFMSKLQQQFPATIALLTSSSEAMPNNRPNSVIMHTSASKEDLVVVNGMTFQDANHNFVESNCIVSEAIPQQPTSMTMEYELPNQVEPMPKIDECFIPEIIQEQQGEQPYVTTKSPEASPLDSGYLTTSSPSASSVTSRRSSRTSSFGRPPKVWVLRSPGSLLDFKVTAIDKVPCYSTQIEIEVPVKDGVIIGTNCVYEEIVKNKPPIPRFHDSQESLNTIFFESRFGSLIFRKLTNTDVCDVETFDVEVVSLSTDSRIILEGMTESLWNILQQLISASLFFNNCTTVSYYLPVGYQANSSENVLGECVYKKLLLTVGMDNVIKCVTAGVEVFDFYQQLPMEDQIILLKDGMIGVGFLFLLLLYDRNQNCKVHTALQDQLMIYISLDTMRENPLAVPIADAFKAVLLSVYEFLQKDHFVICLFAVVYFFQTHPGISCPEIVHDQRMIFCTILGKYIRGKIKAGEWKESYQDIWDNIRSIRPHVANLNSDFVKMTNALEKEMRDNEQD